MYDKGRVLEAIENNYIKAPSRRESTAMMGDLLRARLPIRPSNDPKICQPLGET